MFTQEAVDQIVQSWVEHTKALRESLRYAEARAEAMRKELRKLKGRN